jgi:hypothetical protein
MAASNAGMANFGETNLVNMRFSQESSDFLYISNGLTAFSPTRRWRANRPDRCRNATSPRAGLRRLPQREPLEIHVCPEPLPIRLCGAAPPAQRPAADAIDRRRLFDLAAGA